MGCISVHTERVGGTLRVCTARTGGTLRVSVSVVCTVNIEELFFACGNITGYVSVSVVCTVNIEEGYVRTDRQCVWLTEDNLWEADVKVESNRQWTAG